MTALRNLSVDAASLPLSMTTLLLLIGSLIVFLLGHSTYASWSRLRHIPGPAGARLSKWWMFRNTLSGNMHLALKEVTDQYGPLARIGPNTLVTNDPEALRKMWAVRSQYKKGEFYQAVRFDPDRDNLISMRDDYEHGVLRAKMAAGYAGKDNDNLESTIDRGITSFIDLIERKYVSDASSFRPVDLARKMQFMTLDVISWLAMGEPFGFIERDEDVHHYIRILEESMPVMLTLTVFPWLAKLLQSRLCRRLMPSEQDRVGFGVFIGVAKQIVADRLASDNPYRRDMLGSFLAHGLTREEAEGEMLVQIIAGSDTTATAVRMIITYLLSSPLTYAKLCAEIRSASRGPSPVVSSPVTDAEARRRLPYLQAVIREGMRMHPPVAGLMGVLVPPGGDVLCGKAVPEGVEVGWTSFGLQRREDVYGPDAACFRPERWLEAEAEAAAEAEAEAAGLEAEEEGKKNKGVARARFARMNMTWDLIFKYGKWQCLGKPIALIEMNKVFVELLRRYDFTMVDAAKPMTSSNAGIFLQSNLMVKVTRAEY